MIFIHVKKNNINYKMIINYILLENEVLTYNCF